MKASFMAINIISVILIILSVTNILSLSGFADDNLMIFPSLALVLGIFIFALSAYNLKKGK